MPSASVCGAFATSAMSATGAAGTPASVSRACQCAVSFVASARSRIAQSSSRWLTRSGFVREAGVVDELGQPEDAADRGEQAVVAAGDHQLAVARREHLVRAPPSGSASPGRAARCPRRSSRRGDSRRSRSPSRRATRRRPMPSPVELALEQRRQHADGRPCPGALVDQRRADAHAGPAGLAGDRDQAARRLHQRVVARLLAAAARRARRRRPSSRRAVGCAPAARRGRARARRRARGAGSAGTRRRRRRAAATPRGRARRGARAPASACPRWRRGTSSPRRSRTAAPRRGRRRPCRAARP